MKFWRFIPVALVGLVTVLCLTAPLKAQLTMTNVGGGGFGGGGCSYTGPGNAASGAIVFYGVRAYTAATCGNKLLNVCDPTGAVCTDFLSSASTGDIVFQTVNGTACGTTDTCVVKTAYDLTGNGFDLTQATNGNRPILKHNCTTNGKACMAGNGVTLLGPSSGSLSQSQPFTTVSVANVASSAGNQVIIGTFTSSVVVTYKSPSGFCSMNAGGNQAVACTDNARHSVMAQYSAGSPAMIVDNVNTGVGSVGSNNLSTAVGIMGDNSGVNEFLTTSDLSEAGIWPGAVNIYSNQSAYYGGF